MNEGASEEEPTNGEHPRGEHYRHGSVNPVANRRERHVSEGLSAEERAAIERLVARERATTDRNALAVRTTERRRNLANTVFIACCAAVVSSLLTLSTVPLWLQALIDMGRWILHLRVVLAP